MNTMASTVSAASAITDPPSWLPWALLGAVLLGWIVLSFIHRDENRH